MSVVSKTYNADGSTKIFSSDFKVLSESHIQVYFTNESEDNIVSKSDYDLISDAAVFKTAPASGTVVIVKVGTTPDDLLTSTTNITTVASNIDAINEVNANKSNINIVGSNIDNINIVANNTTNINTVAGDTVAINEIYSNRTEIYQADTNAAIATAQASIATTKANEASVSATNAEQSYQNVLNYDILSEGYKNDALNSATEASNSATNASESATSASSSATSASNSASASLASANNSETSAINSANSAVTSTAQAVISTNKANESSASALSASSSATSASASASTATSQATIATNKATEASNSASEAETYRDESLANSISSSTSASNAATSESNASTSETNASVSATTATTQATIATTKASEAQASAEQSASSASSASQIVLGQSTGRANIKPVLNLDFANQKRLDSRVDFSRESTATYYDGKKQVKAEENLLKYSEDFSNGAWTKIGSTISGGEVAPNGTLTANKVTVSLDGTGSRVLQNQPTVSGAYTMSFYAKQGTATTVTFSIIDQGTVILQMDIDLSNGTINSKHASIINESVTDAGNGWYRISGTYNFPDSYTADTFEIRGGSTALIGDTYYIWGMQLEQRDFATAYTPTTDKPITNYIPVLSTAQANEPRFDYDLETKECKGLLIEEQRTNLFKNTEDITLWPFAKVISGTSERSNSGFNFGFNIGKVDVTSSGGGLRQQVDIASGFSYTVSFILKSDLPEIKFQLENGTAAYGASAVAKFNPSNGEITRTINTTAKSTYFGNDYYKYEVTIPASTGTLFNFELKSDTLGTYFIGGLQLEHGSFATSYIPTNGSQVTRTADNCSITGDNFSSFYNPSEGTFYADFEMTDISDNGPVISNGVTSPMFIYTNFGQSQFRIYDKITTDETYGAVADGYNKLASYYNETEIGILANGENISPRTRQDFTSFQNVSNLRLFYANNGHIKKVAYYDKALSDTELQLMTQG